MRNRITPRIVRTTASIIAQREYGPAPSIIGIGPRNIMVPIVAGAPERTAVTITTIIPMKIRRKPNRKSLKGVDHGKASTAGAGAPGLRWL